MKPLAVILFALLAFSPFSLDFAAKEKIEWVDFSELPEKLREERRPLMVFIHTDWCKFCKLQANNTFTKTEVVKRLNEKYYCLQLDAESKEQIKFLNRVYHPQSIGYHSLAEMLGKEGGELSFPTTVMLNESFQLEGRLVGFTNAKTLLRSLTK